MRCRNRWVLGSCDFERQPNLVQHLDLVEPKAEGRSCFPFEAHIANGCHKSSAGTEGDIVPRDCRGGLVFLDDGLVVR